MRKLILTISLFTVILLSVNGQSDIPFNSVPVVNGKVVFEYFILTEAGVTPEQGYAKLQKWVRSKYKVIKWFRVSDLMIKGVSLL